MEKFRRFTDIFNHNKIIIETEISDERCLLYMTPDGRHLYSIYSTSLESEQINRELSDSGYTVLSSFNVEEAKDILESQREEFYDNGYRRC